MEGNFKIVYMSPRDLIPYEKNAKIHSKKQVQDLAAAIQKRGFDQPITVDRNMVIITGHGRREASLFAGLERVPVIVRDDLDDAAVMAKRLEDNRLASTDYDTQLLADEALELDALGEEVFGFDEREWDMLTADLAADFNTDEVMGDLQEEIDTQSSRHDEVSESVDTQEVRLGDAFGFRTIPGSHQRLLADFLADIEDKTGRKGQAAFLAYLESQYSV